MRNALKKCICITIAAMMLLAVVPVQGAVIPVPTEFTKHGIIYSVLSKGKGNHGTVSVIGIDTQAEGEDLSTIIIPQTVRKYQVSYDVIFIDSFAFADTGIIKSVTLGKGIESIKTGAFYGCVNLSDITIPETVSNIDKYAFGGCGQLSVINIAEENEYYSAENGELYSKDGETLISAPGASGKYTVREGVRTIGAAAFDSNKLITNVILSDDVRRIEEGAFYNCTSLSTVDLGKTEYIGKDAFCKSGLTSIKIPETTTELTDNPFAYCDMLSDISVKKANTKFKVRKGMLLNSSGKKVISSPTVTEIEEFPSTVTTIGAYAFAGNKNLSTIVFPSKIKKFKEGAFDSCTSLKIIRFTSRNLTLPEITEENKGVFFNTTYNLIAEIPYSEESFTEGSAEKAVEENSPGGVLITNY
ncbi:MAG: leucine-rich repeat domain-containing protein [Lachnospiraceae bacterium]|nr:leucine-rich repeat domain-containing protein [Lachnospiraceae bacterium]